MTKMPVGASDADDLMFKIDAVVKLKMEMQKTKMGQVTLARLAGVPSGDVTDILSGNITRYGIDTFHKLLRVFAPPDR